MCRWAAYSGKEIYLEDVVSAPRQSLIRQSQRALEAKTETNGDGFGIAWYHDREEPGLYRDILPAWNDTNLISLAHQVRSRLFLAHVRASTGTETNRSNCHPFAVGPWTFMHNGQIGHYHKLRRKLDALIRDDLYSYRTGTTDSEALFLLALGYGLQEDPVAAIQKTVFAVANLAEEAGVPFAFRFTAALSDGKTIYGIRHASDDFAPTLYHRSMPDASGRILASEPLETDDVCWTAVPANSFVTMVGNDIQVVPFCVDERSCAAALRTPDELVSAG